MIYKVRNADGKSDSVSEENASLAEADGYDIIVSKDGQEETVPFSKLQLAKADGFLPISDITPTGAGIEGVKQGLSFGLSDEII